MKKVILLLLSVTLFFCTENKGQNKVGGKPTDKSNKQMEAQVKPKREIAFESGFPKANDSIREKKIELTTFNSIPDDIDGCGCALFLSQKDWEEQNYIYADAGNIACVKINGELKLLPLKKYYKKTNTYLYSDKLLSVRITHIKSKPSKEDETTNVEKIITITKGKDKLERRVIGYCGC